MGVVMKVGEPNDFPKPPAGFPKCGNFAYNPGSEQSEEITSRFKNRGGTHVRNNSSPTATLSARGKGLLTLLLTCSTFLYILH